MANSVYTRNLTVEEFKNLKGIAKVNFVKVPGLTYKDENGNDTGVQRMALAHPVTGDFVGSISRKVAVCLLAGQPLPKTPCIGVREVFNQDTAELSEQYTMYIPNELEVLGSM